MTTPEKPDTPDKPDTPRAILDAAVQLFAERGYNATTLRDIADLVGIKAGSIYYHFPSKEAMLWRLYSETLTQLLGDLDAALPDGHDMPPLDALGVWVDRSIRFHIAYREGV